MGRLGDYPKLEVRGRFLRVKAPLCRVVPRAANRNKHDCRWQSYLYYAVTPSGVTEGVYAIDTVKAIVRYSPTRTNRTPPPSRLTPTHLPPTRREAYATLFLRIEFERAGHAAAPTMLRRKCNSFKKGPGRTLGSSPGGFTGSGHGGSHGFRHGPSAGS